MNVLSRGGSRPVTHIIHIADTHVRTGDRVSARVDEYRHVFGRFVDEISEIDAVRGGTALLVIAGDVFHNKGRLETEGAVVIYEWLNRLLDVLPVLIICGNHDFRQEDPGYTDMIEMLIAPYRNAAHRHPVHYLRDTGHYIWENIGFGVTTVKDTLKAYNTCGILTDLPGFPSPAALDAACVDARIALFHGSVSQSALPGGEKVSEYTHGYPLEWFKGYDIAMLGDNHVQQLNSGLGGTLAWAYPGSLVQQDGGEPLLGHGYVLWDIRARSGTLCHIPNDYATVNMYRGKGGRVYVRPRPREAVPLPKAVKQRWFPKCPQVRVIGTQGDDVIVEQELRKASVKPLRIFLSRCAAPGRQGADGAGGGDGGGAEGAEGEAEDISRQITLLADLNSPERWVAFAREKAPDIADEVLEWLRTPGRLLIRDDAVPPALSDKVAAKNRAIQQAIDAYEAKVNGTQQQHYSIVLRHMEWEYLMCFGAKNWFDFSHMDGRVALLNGRNASGKSSFIDVLCLAIFGDPSAMRSDISGSKMSVKVIHDQKPTTSKHDSAYVRLLFSVNGELYEIRRSFTVKQKDEVLVSKVNKIATIHRIDDGVMVLVADGTSMVNDWMAKRFGSLPELLMSTVLCQTDGSNFFTQSESDQIRIIEKALHMETIHSYENVLHEASKAYRHIVNELSTYLRGISDGTGHAGGGTMGAEELEGAAERLAEMSEELGVLLERKAELSRRSEDLLLRIKGAVDTYGYELEEAEEGLRNEQGRVDGFAGITPDILRTAHVTQERLARVEEELKERPRAGCLLEEARRGLAAAEGQLAAHARRRPGPEDEPQMSEVYIAEKEAEHSAWLNTVRYMEIDLGVIEGRIGDLLSAQEGLYAELRELQGGQKDAPRPRAGHKGWLKELGAWEEFASGVSEMTVEELDQRASEVKEYLNGIERVRAEAGALSGQLEALAAEQKSYRGVEFNEHCPACQKNPLKKRLDEVTKELRSAEAKAKRLRKRLAEMEKTESDYRAELEELGAARPDRAKYEHRCDMMDREKAEWLTAERVWREEDCRAGRAKELQQDIRTINEELAGLRRIKTEHDVWQRELQRLEAEREAIAGWRAWEERQKALEGERDTYDSAIRWDELQRELSENRELFKRIEAYEHAVSERDEWQNIVYSVQWMANRDEHEALSARCGELKEGIASLGARARAAGERARLVRGCEEALVAIQARQSRLQDLAAVFVGEKGVDNQGFKAWVYTREIVPLIEGEVNRFIEPLDDFRLVIRYHNGALLYSIRDRGNEPTLDHASGYQRFLVGLAMRIALSRIGAIGQNVKHIVIDEGFTACDASNIQKVGSILRGLMAIGGYSSVLLMSHLEAIREVAETRIDIRRSEDDAFSNITWGVPYPVFAKNKKVELAAAAGEKKRRNVLKKIS